MKMTKFGPIPIKMKMVGGKLIHLVRTAHPAFAYSDHPAINRQVLANRRQQVKAPEPMAERKEVINKGSGLKKLPKNKSMGAHVKVVETKTHGKVPLSRIEAELKNAFK